VLPERSFAQIIYDAVEMVIRAPVILFSDSATEYQIT
jgi:hypothetical protein